MRKLKFLYETKLAFSDKITKHSFVLRCLPKQTDTQHIKELDFSVSPQETVARSFDSFGNETRSGYIGKPHDFFAFRVSGIVVTDLSLAKKEELNSMYKFPTPLTTITSGAGDFYALAARKGDDVTKALAMSERLHKSFVYKQGCTTTATTAQEALSLGMGVCQDYTHIMLALCRNCGIPARYIAGFMVGEGATHAWLEIYTDGHWFGIDPTNNRLADEQYIKLCEGRDASDCVIDKGVFFGKVEQKQEVYVKVTEIN